MSHHARQLRCIAAKEIVDKLKVRERDGPPLQKKAKPVAAEQATSSSAAAPPLPLPPVAALDVMAAPDYAAPPRSPSVASRRSFDGVDDDAEIESILSEDSRCESEDCDLDEYIVPCLEPNREFDLEVDDDALV